VITPGRSLVLRGFRALAALTVAAVLVVVLVIHGPALAASTPAVPVIDVMPDEGERGVSPTTNVQAVFNRDMDPDTLNEKTAKLRKKDSNKPPEEATISCDDPCRTVTLDPTRPHLHPGRSYRATIVGGEDGVKSATGETFGQSKVWSFRVGRG
jgi:hypothetical protein